MFCFHVGNIFFLFFDLMRKGSQRVKEKKSIQKIAGL